jgi:hypothetical protein
MVATQNNMSPAVQSAAGAQVAALQAAGVAVTQQQAYIINSFRGQIYISDQLDVQDTPLYDTLTYTAGASITKTNSAFWANVANNSGKTIAQTNMTNNEVLPAPEAFAVFSVKVGWSEGVLRSDLQTLVDGCAYQLNLGKKPYQQGNLRHYSPGWGIFGVTTKTAESLYTNSYPSAGSMNLIDIKLVIANQMSFLGFLDGFASGSQTLSSAGAGLILINEFGGLYARGVQ